MARIYTPEELANRTFFVTAGFCVAIVIAIQVVLWFMP